MTANLELIFDRLGHFGRFQAFIYFISVFQAISCGIHYLASVFISVTPKYACIVIGNISTILLPNSSSTSVMDDAWSLWTSFKDHLVVQLDNGEIWELHQCRRYRREEPYNFTYEYEGNKTMFPCSDGFIYDQTKVKSSIVTDWNLVCEREWLAKLVQPTFMLGVLIGAVVFGDLADRVGRRPIMWFTSTGQFLFGIAVAFTSDYYSFVVVRFLLAMVSSGYLVAVFVYVTEYVGVKARSWASMHVHAAFAVGVMVVALVGYLERTWWLYQIFISITTLPFVLCCWKLPETPFWLHLQGRNKEVQEVMNTMQRWNKVSTPLRLSELYPIDSDNLQAKKNKESEMLPSKKHNMLDLFSNWSITKRTISVWLIWFTGSLGYYVFSLNSVNLGGNEYFNLFLTGAVEFPSYIVACIGMDLLGRRNTLAPFLLLSALICGLTMLIPQDYTILTIVASMFGKFAIGVAFGLIYLYTAELYPTIIRSLAVGSGSMMCRVGSIVAPFCVYLKDVWIFFPQVIVGVVALLTGVLTLMLPETLGKPLTNTFEEAAELENTKDNKNSPQDFNGLVLDTMVPFK